ncbi:HupE/UreJ family protein [Paraglaciecola hydrolytica]|uniref:HupE / UreJ protein n=1 Tax=Paraglaciecola hydrolytica TaxID=1799789 RepID=A0A148KLV6_9ALTE|nr:HupE/UreJ family protein [Paraglaciecola hydrolytica]KXI27277.1 hypothetical protein AX660_21350 [Paraglaciecola hydrolytica]
MPYLFRCLRAACVLIVFCGSLHTAHAHQMSTAYINLAHRPLQDEPLQSHPQQEISKTESQGLYGQLQIRWFDLELVIGLDANTDGELSWAEVNARSAEIKAFALANLKISSQQQDCVLNIHNDIQTDMHFDEGYLVLNFESNCVLLDINDKPQELAIRYDAIFAQDADHKLLVNADLFEQHFSGVIDSQNHVYHIEPENNPILKVIRTYIYQGILHIFKGTDHILFLCALLLTCVLQRRDQEWAANNNKRQVLKHTAWIITAFTLAHSITLTATAMDLIVPSSHWVEFGIALSVVLTALNNIWPLVLRLGWITFAFGLLHGMGFAGVLGELGLAKEQKLLSVLSFNLGVEVGQLMILAVVMPLLFFAAKRRWYQRYGIQIASGIIALIALQWCIERL